MGGISDPDADVAEQRRPLSAEQESTEAADEAAARVPVPLEADPLDVADQRRDVPLEDADELG